MQRLSFPRAFLLLIITGWRAGILGTAETSSLSGLLFKASPLVLELVDLSAPPDAATISDIQAADFDGDGRTDLAVAWYVTNFADPRTNRRMLTIFFNRGGWFERGVDINLYVYDAQYESLSVFRNGTGAITIGDFDGDGRPDLAVLPFAGDELWILENRGGGQFVPHLKFPFGFNSSGNALTPPRGFGADFDGDGRDELVYVADPVQQIGGEILHFWSTSGSIADMQRTDWGPLNAPEYVQWARALAIVRFAGEPHPGLCFSAARHPPLEQDPVLMIWHEFDPVARGFQVAEFPLPVLVSDIVPLVRTGQPTTLLLSDSDGTSVHWWGPTGNGFNFGEYAAIDGYAGLGANRGMAEALGDINGDGVPDLVTKQKLGEITDTGQIEITLGSEAGGGWALVHPTPINTAGFRNEANNQILRPHNLVVTDLLGNTLPEVVGGFAVRQLPGSSRSTLSVALWQNGCAGDVNRDGVTDAADLALLLAALGTCRGAPGFNADADLDKDGCITSADLALLQADLGCGSNGCNAPRAGDTNCDCAVNFEDVNSFILALQGRAAYEAQYPGCPWLNADIDFDGRVDLNDINPFIGLLGSGGLSANHAEQRR